MVAPAQDGCRCGTADGGVHGQIIEFHHDSGDRRVIAGDFSVILEGIVDALHSGSMDAETLFLKPRRTTPVLSREEKEEKARQVDAVVAQIDKLPPDVF